MVKGQPGIQGSTPFSRYSDCMASSEWARAQTPASFNITLSTPTSSLSNSEANSPRALLRGPVVGLLLSSPVGFLLFH